MADDILHGLIFVAGVVAPLALPLLFFGALERLVPAGPLKSARGWWLNLRLMVVYLAVPTVLAVAIKYLVSEAGTLSGGGLVDLLPWISISGVLGVIAGCLIYLLVWDFFYYWWHRAQHQFPALWRMHSLHHMDETLGVSANMRVHWLEEIGRTVVMFMPMAFLFNLPVATGVVAIALTFWGAFIHSNLRLHLGPMSAVIAGPQVHRVHHSRLDQHHDRNFAAFFPVWDLVFGTYHHPARDEFPPTGVEGMEEVGSVWEAIVHPFRGRRFRAPTE
ncbi:sterol desaturase family protein [Novosphingobium sp. JCM 18896]|uniref:sterol desaturase family protein n=1 Tax=Novosphingobium sp. JCM 18896 TaxID=2989731 RepID=UPI002221FB81|nr:sterol desaturase family protein [Novosphingobium sp. JCM 18896]MCW1428274.1 sterol desaturase family protein [Novosphingobium sp. JCM 18896]